jgi:hypothetical protein
VPEPSAFEDELAIEELKRHKSPGVVDNLNSVSVKLADISGTKRRHN